MATIKRNASAQWSGTGKDGKGAITTQSGVLSSTPYSFSRRFGDEKGTNPEELIAAAHAGCFTMALAFGLQGEGFTPTELSTEPPSRWSRRASDFASAGPLSLCAPRCHTSMRRHLRASLARPRRTARCPKS